MSSHSTPTDLESLRKLLDPVPCRLVRQLHQAGHEAYIVGGAIRDLLLGHAPKDYDISTSARPEEVRRVFGRHRCHVIGRRFRLAHVYAGGDIYEVSTFRRRPDAQERKGRKPEDGPIIWNDNCFGSLEEDAQRRDFTVNALYFDVVGNQGILDFSNGLKDIRDGVVRCIGAPDERIEEDPVRMLRALKLVAQCGFTLEPHLEQAIRRQAHTIRLASPARLFEELLKLLNHPAASETLETMHAFGFLRHFWPTLDEAWEEVPGQMAKKLLRLRGAAIRQGGYSDSRRLALSTTALPFLMFALNPAHPAEFWTRGPHTADIMHRALLLLFDGFKVPRLFLEHIPQVVGLVPPLLATPPDKRALNHPEYSYGRALAALLVQLFGWDSAKLDALPKFAIPDDDNDLPPPAEWDAVVVPPRQGRQRPSVRQEEIPGLVPLRPASGTPTPPTPPTSASPCAFFEEHPAAAAPSVITDSITFTPDSADDDKTQSPADAHAAEKRHRRRRRTSTRRAEASNGAES